MYLNIGEILYMIRFLSRPQELLRRLEQATRHRHAVVVLVVDLVCPPAFEALKAIQVYPCSDSVGASRDL